MSSLRRSGRKCKQFIPYVPGSSSFTNTITTGGDGESETATTSPQSGSSVSVSASADYLLILNFTSHWSSGVQSHNCYHQIGLKFDKDHKFLGQVRLDPRADCKLRLIRRASGRLALNTTNEKFQDSKSALVSIQWAEVNANGQGHTNRGAPVILEEDRQYTWGEKASTLARGVGATLYAPIPMAAHSSFGAVRGIATGVNKGFETLMKVTNKVEEKIGSVAATVVGAPGVGVAAALGATAGSVAGAATGAASGAQRSFNYFVGDDNLSAEDQELFAQDAPYYDRGDGQEKQVNVPFRLVIAHLRFEGLWSGQPRLLSVVGQFRKVRVWSRASEIPAPVGDTWIESATLFEQGEKSKVKSEHKEQCKQSKKCLYFKPETAEQSAKKNKAQQKAREMSAVKAKKYKEAEQQ